MLYPVLIILALIGVAILSNRATRECRWREYRHADGPFWRCAACGAETVTPNGKPPKICLRHKG
ncbi:hypothetical protein SAMN05216196_104255 [Lutimaribacter pacificus]|uniref:Uncharacterized protein n=1 Tax=Lutimaribacter pacificus TaxID=391948 RepID=A0A1H0I5N2_9RHOB|nr:hypothetical protein [Lutimaribacter pacificus]SDO26728.1 hypothetical protein SAMN05216196_104255 [Lutimaribacter pacificus]SHK26021.1 hypothetical protein SAMN05444142_104130 [Lutimaribacter pacificus]